MVIFNFKCNIIFSDEEYKRQLQGLLSHTDPGHDYYFGSYSSSYIHEDMLKDRVRTIAYMRAIEENK